MTEEISPQEAKLRIRRLLEELQARYRGRNAQPLPVETKEERLERDFQRAKRADEERNEFFQRRLFAAAGLNYEDYKDHPRDADGFLIFPEDEDDEEEET